ncbi:hypothetical protein HC026_01695 [Lactobacillus sp. LC28-10]|uniref:Uncharacterized protein n=1 Tax=Secundilactobacillus angelensis TaxID=2722706 RepID=A0ABX1KUM7_9LACO|nr:hypothetical protein [Secundilactobacillus angelensis]MCH5461177.1 hypothetical protein [Secundilactobacillus angelensis]NLR17627.1 hypothetical protein [Secundilactobacillus angelensis]
MRLGELITLMHQLDPSLKLGIDSQSILPVSGMSASDNRLLFHTATQTPLTVGTFQQHAVHFDQQLIVFRSNDDRLYGFRQSEHWLLFK